MPDIITIDGPASSGKNTAAALLGEHIQYQVIDSGSIYRAFAYFLQSMGPDMCHGCINPALFSNLEVGFEIVDCSLKVLLSGEDVTQYLYTPEVTRITPTVGAVGEIRQVVAQKQHELVAARDSIVIGRDVGSEVFPNARVKFFLTSDVEVRAYRRYQQLIQEGVNVTYEDTLEALRERDEKDRNRKVSPFRMPENAIIIDTTHMTIAQVHQALLTHI